MSVKKEEMKLRTLKDFDWGFLNTNKEGKVVIGERTEYSEKAIKFLDLKQEAIKHIKEMKKEWDKFVKDGCDPKNDFRYREFDRIEYQITWIKHFFNIKDEDIK